MPRGALRRLAGPPRVNDRGDVLDVQAQLVVKLSELTHRGAFDDLGPEKAREEMDRSSRLVDVLPEPLHRVEDLVLPGPAGDLAVRRYVPGEGPRPLLVWYHGGGYVIGGLESHDPFCRRLAARSGCTVLSVDYRLAPENRFPAAVEDALAAFTAVAERAESLGGRPGPVAIGGDSAGGNLSAVVARLARDRGGPLPALQVLVYPATDMRRGAASHRLFAEGYFLDAAMIDWFLRLYLGDMALERDPRASPLLVDDLSGLPPAVVVTGGFDPLRDEGEAYARRLAEAGVTVDHRHHPTLLHGFVNMGGAIDAARAAVDDLASAIRAHLA